MPTDYDAQARELLALREAQRIRRVADLLRLVEALKASHAEKDQVIAELSAGQVEA